MPATKQTIYYTLTDESPALATYSLLPIVRAFTAKAGLDVKMSDLSLAGRILAAFADRLNEGQKVADDLAVLGELTKDPDVKLIKLPNISASISQLTTCIAELQSQGYDIPDFVDDPQNDEEAEAKVRYSKVLGSAVNPVLREGNSDRRAPPAVKQYVRQFPHAMGEWSQASKTHVDYMRDGDFFSREQSVCLEKGTAVRIEFVNAAGEVTVKNQLQLQPGEILDSMTMSVKALRQFFEDSMNDAKATGVVWSLHVKATMMKISHSIVFGHAVTVFFDDLFAKHAALFKALGVNPNNGLSSVYDKIETLPDAQREEILQDIGACYKKRPELAMVDSAKGITHLHVSSNIIVDASVPAMIRNSGKLWGADGQAKDAKAVSPERTYTRIFQEAINFCKTHGAFDPATMGSVSNIGLMAKKAEEYGSHDKTYEMIADGIMRVVDAEGTVLMQHQVEKGDIWRACQTQDVAVRDWVGLGVSRARQAGVPAVFWLDDERAHDAELIKKVHHYLKEHDTDGLDLRIMRYTDAIRFSMERSRRGQDTISITGNVLRDYLTDLFPILELGTSAKMLSIVPMLNGGRMYETGAAGTAPVLVQQLLAENHLQWDSLGEMMALAALLDDAGIKNDDRSVSVLGTTLSDAIETLLKNNKSPSAKTGELDSRGSHFYLSLYWAQALAAQTEDVALAGYFSPIAQKLAEKESDIVSEMAAVQGSSVALDGYYHASQESVQKVMRPSTTFNAILASVNG